MKIFISYFYNLRFFPQNMIPISTAIWDPKWYHDFKGQDHKFIDKRGVLVGLRFPELSPAKCEAHCCPCDDRDLSKCEFIPSYRKMLNDQVDFDNFIQKVNLLCERIKEKRGFDDVDICLLVHEKPDNPCSERGSLIEWLGEHGVVCEEWKKG